MLILSLLSGCGKPLQQVAIGTGSPTGVYYPAGGALAELLNQGQTEHGIKMQVRSTGGSVYNINAVVKGDLEFGICQSDRQYQACRGLAEWKDNPQSELRAICSLHPEMVTLVAAVNSEISTLEDLRGKKVNLGNPGSGQRGNALDVLRTAGIDYQTDITAESLKAAEQASMLQDGRIDAFFYTVGHPNGSIKEATAGQRRPVKFVPITGMEPLLAQFPFYAKATIPRALYPKAENEEDVATIGVMTTLVTSAQVPEDTVYALTRALFCNLDKFKTRHPAFQSLTPEGMLRGLSAPFHPGAIRYYREIGLMPEGEGGK